jgi:AraC family L-rhamnose operon regulatory protein RhaS
MVTEYSEKRNGYMTLLHANFMKLAVFLTRKYEHSEITEIDNRISIAESVAYMEANFTKPISIEELAILANISSRHFSRIFRQTYQTTPMKYLTALKMQHASRLLINTTKSITEIAFICGYNDSNYFTKHLVL